MGGKKELEISSDTITELEERASNSNFESVDSYAEFILEEALHQLEESVDSPDEREVHQRLQSLGYVE